MSDFFYFLGSFIILGILFLAVFTKDFNSDFTKLKKYNEHIVVDKDKRMAGGMMENFVVLRQKSITGAPDSTQNSVAFRCDDIMFESMEVGDTINYQKYEKKYNLTE